MGREEGGGFRMGNTCIPVADSFRYMAKPIQKLKKKKRTMKETINFMNFPTTDATEGSTRSGFSKSNHMWKEMAHAI